ncbi:MAG: hypothetical protein ASARMPREDX12_000684 [Alectoria sarmentosa]|nr:MAG: hypothetical protein ASARMPREDX12_000684 [Alectoria sarmentosa]
MASSANPSAGPSSTNPPAGPSSANPPAGPSSTNPPTGPSPAIVEYTTPLKTMIVLYFRHHAFPEFAIQWLVNHKTGDPHCNGKVQRDEQVKVLQDFKQNEWAYRDVNIGRYIAQGRTDPRELDQAVGLAGYEIYWIRTFLNIDEKPALRQNSAIYAAAHARLVENRDAQELLPLPP